jgi:hypothetical protein
MAPLSAQSPVGASSGVGEVKVRFHPSGMTRSKPLPTTLRET